MNKNHVSKKCVDPIQVFKGIYRRTLAYNRNIMLCHFYLKKDTEVPLHNHKEHQVGYVIRGKLKFFTEKGEFVVKEGDSYIFDSNVKHGASILEDSEVIDIFNPAREDYK
ncbi:MAG: cupin domain-containing protein [Promethearchaeota archaeon]